MNTKHIGIAVAAAALFSAPVFAQGGGSASGGNSASGTSGGTPAPASTSANVNQNTGSQAGSTTGGQVSSGTGVGVTSGTGLAVNPSTAPAGARASVLTTTSTSPVTMAPGVRLIPGGAMVQQDSTTTLGGPSGNVSGSQTVVTTHWVNVPANVTHRGDFQRWTQLK